MLFRKLLPLFAALFSVSAASAHAQAGVYGTFSGQTFGGITCPSFVSPCGDNSGSVKPYGVTVGGYYDFLNLKLVRLGVDARGDVLTSNKRADSTEGGNGSTRQYAALVGVRGSFHTPIPWVHPYGEIAGGIIRNNASGTYTYTTGVDQTITPPSQTTTATFNPNVYKIYPAVKGFIGLDLTVLPWLDLRAVEVGFGEAFGSSTTGLGVTATQTGSGVTLTSPAVVSTSQSSHFLDSIGGGVVFHIPR